MAQPCPGGTDWLNSGSDLDIGKMDFVSRQRNLCAGGVGHTLTRSAPVIQETSEKIRPFKHVLGFLDSRFGSTSGSSVIGRHYLEQ